MARVLATMSGPGGGTRPLAAILRWLSTPQEECGEEAERQKETVLCALSLYGGELNARLRLKLRKI